MLHAPIDLAPEVRAAREARASVMAEVKKAAE